ACWQRVPAQYPRLFAHWAWVPYSWCQDDRSRVTGDCYARICGSPEVRFLRATRPKTVLETALNQELTEQLGHENHGSPDPDSGNIRNGTRAKTVLTESTGQVQVQVPRDRDGSFEPQIVK